ncbi:DUF4189 domain-containing protein [Pseudoxanthomonas sp. LARHCG66]|jgi:hypothetical protein
MIGSMSYRLLRLVPLFLAPLFAVSANAQMACPQGVTPGSSQCLPSGGGGAAPPPAPRWRLTWGAMAEDVATGYVGTSTGQFSRRAARREAMRKCEGMGGVNCKPIFDYKNNCAVVVEPVKFIQGSSTAVYRDGSSVEDASSVALAYCKQQNGRECKVNYSNCTSPVLVN